MHSAKPPRNPAPKVWPNPGQSLEIAAASSGLAALSTSALAGLDALAMGSRPTPQPAASPPLSAFKAPEGGPPLARPTRLDHVLEYRPGKAQPLKPPPRADLPAGHHQWLQVLDAAQARSLNLMAPWLELLRERLRGTTPNAELQALDDRTLLQALHDAAVTAAAALEEKLPYQKRLEGDAVLHLRGLCADVEQQVSVQWQAGPWTGPVLPLNSLLFSRLKLVSGFSEAAARLATQCALQVLAEQGTPMFPGFAAEPAAPEPGHRALKWLSPVKA